MWNKSMTLYLQARAMCFYLYLKIYSPKNIAMNKYISNMFHVDPNYQYYQTIYWVCKVTVTCSTHLVYLAPTSPCTLFNTMLVLFLGTSGTELSFAAIFLCIQFQFQSWGIMGRDRGGGKFQLIGIHSQISSNRDS